MDGEGSGMTYISKQNAIMGVDDEGFIIKIDLDTGILEKSENLPLGNRDLEGITHSDEEDIIYVIEEGNSTQYPQMHKYNFETDEVLSTYNIPVFSRGVQGAGSLAWVPDPYDEGGSFFIGSHHSGELFIYKWNTAKDALVYHSNYTLSTYSDLSGMYYYEEYLFLLFDYKNKMVVYSIDHNGYPFEMINEYDITEPPENQEGIAVLASNGFLRIFISSDTGNITESHFNIEDGWIECKSLGGLSGWEVFAIVFFTLSAIFCCFSCLVGGFFVTKYLSKNIEASSAGNPEHMITEVKDEKDLDEIEDEGDIRSI